MHWSSGKTAHKRYAMSESLIAINAARKALDKFARKERDRHELRTVHAFNVLEASRGLDRFSVEYIGLMKLFNEIADAWHDDLIAEQQAEQA